MPNPEVTQIRRVDEKLTQNRPENLVGFFGLGLVGFKLIRVSLGFYHWGQNLAKSSEIRPKSNRIRQDLAQF